MNNNTLALQEARVRETYFVRYGVDAIQDFALLLQVVNTLYGDNANIILNWVEETVTVSYDNNTLTYRWI
jgi:hypothetical protein